MNCNWNVTFVVCCSSGTPPISLQRKPFGSSSGTTLRRLGRLLSLQQVEAMYIIYIYIYDLYMINVLYMIYVWCGIWYIYIYIHHNILTGFQCFEATNLVPGATVPLSSLARSSRTKAGSRTLCTPAAGSAFVQTVFAASFGTFFFFLTVRWNLTCISMTRLGVHLPGWSLQWMRALGMSPELWKKRGCWWTRWLDQYRNILALLETSRSKQFLASGSWGEDRYVTPNLCHAEYFL